MSHTIWKTLSERANRTVDRAFAGIKSREDWETVRSRRKEELLEALGLNQTPKRQIPAATCFGEFAGTGFRARKVGYQILPDCWASACFYYPDPLPLEKAPGVLYLCGHAALGSDHYQSHAIRWARRGYVCLIVDTIEQADNPGEHHGFSMGLHEEWIALGYSGAGGEVWNSLCALDLLAADPHVNPDRLATTGVSGGGACSFFLAAIDERIKAVSSLCGISTPKDAITHRHLLGHCDCFYAHNVYGRDWSDYAALIAPRPALFCNADHDPLFHPTEVAAFVERTQRIYALYGEKEKCRLVTCPGPHGDHMEFDEATADWLDHHIAGGKRSKISRGKREVPEEVTSVFNGTPPAPNQLHLLPHLLTRRGTLTLPHCAAEWPTLKSAAIDSLKKEILHRQPESRSCRIEREGEWLRTPAGPEAVSITVDRGEADGVSFTLQSCIPTAATATLLSIAGEGETVQNAISRAGTIVNPKTTIYAGLEPRLAGDRSPAPEPSGRAGTSPLSARAAIFRAMALIGTMPVMMTMEDIHATIDYLASQPKTGNLPLYLHGRGDAGIAALYAAILDERVAGVILEEIPGSHLDGAPIPGILRLLDIPQAVGLIAPRPVALVNPASRKWSWPSRLYQRLGCPDHYQGNAVDARAAFEAMRH